ncbi:hypothetical protein TOPH_07364 [Tolypocladium ophioglossoides CBS 100239]|uniref:Uncharacterized protein n=1 Tax=Tolypocladium ophioglossoides (strain CBS 100239) TaxID=1163406 RepID=A0A0L0N1U7_TOLOC|nr:hypothetical protein TOPH_07364 [Tolypocladium ophioglossoides CBS 100239]
MAYEPRGDHGDRGGQDGAYLKVRGRTTNTSRRGESQHVPHRPEAKSLWTVLVALSRPVPANVIAFLSVETPRSYALE